MAGNVEILEGEVLREGSRIRARGQIGVYGNEPFTYPALRTEAATILLDQHAGNVPDAPVVPLLLELTGVSPQEIDRVQGRTVLVTGVLRRMPQGPRKGLLEVSSIATPPDS